MAIVEKYCSPAGAGAHDGSSEANAWTLAEAITNAVNTNRVNMKGTFTLTATVTFNVASSTVDNLTWRGYTTTIGDGGKATITGGAYHCAVTGNYQVFEDIEFTHTTASVVLGAVAITAGFGQIFRTCAFEYIGTGTGCAFYAGNGLTTHHLINCTLKATGGTTAYGAYVRDGGIFQSCTVAASFIGINQQDGAAITFSVLGCLIKGSGVTNSRGISSGGSGSSGMMTIQGNTFYDWHFGYWVNYPGYILPDIICNNIFYTCVYGCYHNQTSQWMALFLNNAFGNTTTAQFNNVNANWKSDTITLTADPFTDKSTDDFSLNDTAGGGAACKAAGLAAPAVP